MKWLLMFLYVAEFFIYGIVFKNNIHIENLHIFIIFLINVLITGWIFGIDDYLAEKEREDKNMKESKKAAERFVIFDRQKNIVDKCPNLEEAKKLVRKLEIEDMTDGVYEIGWYSILDSEKLVFIDKEK